ncbi:hypothetical protein DE146DRAFT_633283 [Phaeosphaeria sp. MPI-PUGE-AT-0046c]|nr:hypothetical protein DE146DRAFT_633283 [Phaeosphaeria sp. MPI-PUGE-AT-0046c]
MDVVVVGGSQRRLAVAAEQASRGRWRVMYGSRAHLERARLPSVLELTPNCAQAPLRKTARPVRCSWATYTSTSRLWPAAIVPADCGKRLLDRRNPLPKRTKRALRAWVPGTCAVQWHRRGAVSRSDPRPSALPPTPHQTRLSPASATVLGRVNMGLPKLCVERELCKSARHVRARVAQLDPTTFLQCLSGLGGHALRPATLALPQVRRPTTIIQQMSCRAPAPTPPFILPSSAALRACNSNARQHRLMSDVESAIVG